MPTAMITLSVQMKGRLFQGISIDSRLARLITEIKEAVSDYAHYLMLMRLHNVLQNPTGYYESRIMVQRQGEDIFLTDSGVVYGPWLEGTSSRNQATRFKGYHSFRITKNEVDQKKAIIAQPLVNRFVSEMNS